MPAATFVYPERRPKFGAAARDAVAPDPVPPRPRYHSGVTAPVPPEASTGRMPTYTVELPTYAPGEAIDAGYVVHEPTRGLRPRRRSRLQRVAIGLSGGTLLIVVGSVLGLATVLTPVGARRTARGVADQELRAELDDGERVLGRAYVSQRRWDDNFRESFGVVAATDRRLLYVGLPPAPWIGRGESGPPELRVQSVPYDVPFVAGAHRQLLGLARGVEVRTPAGTDAFLVPRGEAQRVREIERVVERALQARTEAQQRDLAARTLPPPPPPVYGTHLVRPGEALSTIARRYGTTPDVVRQLNRLQTDAIRIGQRLRVPVQPDSAAAPPVVGGGAPAPVSF